MRTGVLKALEAVRCIRVAVLLTAFIAAEATAQGNFGNLAAGPYNRLVIRGVMVIPGHGGPPAGPISPSSSSC